MVVKDQKVAIPAGLKGDCEGPCSERLESLFARRSKEHLLANLKGFRMLFVGGTDPEVSIGFDDILRDQGAESLAEDILGKIENAEAEINKVEGTFRDALERDPDALLGVHEAVQSITTDMKTRLVTVLSLRVPKEGAGDND
jgi:hypothetical protein